MRPQGPPGASILAIEAYIPAEVQFGSQPIPGVVLITLYDIGGAAPTGSLTGSQPPAEGMGGSLTFVGRRDGREWRVTLPKIAVTRKTAVGCEFAIQGAIERVLLRELGTGETQHEKAFEEQFDIR